MLQIGCAHRKTVRVLVGKETVPTLGIVACLRPAASPSPEGESTEKGPVCRGACGNRLSIHRPLAQGPLQLSRTPYQRPLGTATISEIYFGICSLLRAEWRVAAVRQSTESDLLWPSSSEERGVVTRKLVK